MAKCSVCNYSIPMGMKVKLPAPDNVPICTYCARIYGSSQPPLLHVIQEMWRENDEKATLFEESGSFAVSKITTVHYDEKNRWFYFKDAASRAKKIIYDFADLSEVRYKNEAGQMVTKTKPSLGKAIVGGALFGPAGAVVGAAHTTSETRMAPGVQYASILISSKNGGTEIRVYKPFPAALSSLSKICFSEPEPEPESQNAQAIPATSVADELSKFKSLVDQGVLSDTEFQAIKDKLLGQII